MKKHALQQKIQSIVAQIVDKYHPERVILFGSAARGDFSADSDVDILVIKRDVPTRGIDRQLAIDGLIERNGVALDILIYKQDEIDEGMRLGDPFIAEIMKKGKALYG